MFNLSLKTVPVVLSFLAETPFIIKELKTLVLSENTSKRSAFLRDVTQIAIFLSPLIIVSCEISILGFATSFTAAFFVKVKLDLYLLPIVFLDNAVA